MAKVHHTKRIVFALALSWTTYFTKATQVLRRPIDQLGGLLQQQLRQQNELFRFEHDRFLEEKCPDEFTAYAACVMNDLPEGVGGAEGSCDSCRLQTANRLNDGRQYPCSSIRNVFCDAIANCGCRDCTDALIDYWSCGLQQVSSDCPLNCQEDPLLDKCLEWETTVNERVEGLQSLCDCTETDEIGGWEALCTSDVPYCIDDVCALTLNKSDFNPADDELVHAVCYNYEGEFNDETLCLYEDFESKSCTFTVDEKVCRTCKLCEEDGFAADCSNLGYGAFINTCTQVGLDGPFQIYKNGERTIGESTDSPSAATTIDPISKSTDSPSAAITTDPIEQQCTDLVASFFPGRAEMFQQHCECSESNAVTGAVWQADCRDNCKYCLGEVCAFFFATTFQDAVGGTGTEVASWECNKFLGDFEDEKLCLWERDGSDSCVFNINNENCNSCTICEGGFAVDCSNLGYGTNIDTCNQIGLDGPFQIYANDVRGPNNYTVGECDASSSPNTVPPSNTDPTTDPPTDPEPLEPGELEEKCGKAFVEFFPGLDKSNGGCDCEEIEGEMEGAIWKETCHDKCEYCVADVCAFYSKTVYRDVNHEEIGHWACKELSGFQKEKICIWGQSNSEFCVAMVNGVRCSSCAVCEEGNILDCSNLEESAVVGVNIFRSARTQINTCDKTGLEGPFQIFGEGADDPDVMTVGECVDVLANPVSIPDIPTEAKQEQVNERATPEPTEKGNTPDPTPDAKDPRTVPPTSGPTSGALSKAVSNLTKVVLLLVATIL